MGCQIINSCRALKLGSPDQGGGKLLSRRLADKQPSGFRKLRKIESGSSVTRGSLLSPARARASLALNVEDLSSDADCDSPARLAFDSKALSACHCKAAASQECLDSSSTS